MKFNESLRAVQNSGIYLADHMGVKDIKSILEKLHVYAIQIYFSMFFFILFFRHKNIDIIRLPFYIFIIWMLLKKKLSPKFLIDPVSIGIYLFILAAFISNVINGIPQQDIVPLLNWLFPYYLGKYAIMKWPQTQLNRILLPLLICATVFSAIGILGYLLGWETLFGRELFDQSNRYRYTISATNRAGFYLGVSLVLFLYYFFRQNVTLDSRSLLIALCWLVVFACLFLVKERKTILMVPLIIMALLLLYKHYRVVLVAAIMAGIILVSINIPQRYHFKEMALNKGMLGRFNAWELALGLFKEKPLFGHGYPSFRNASKRYNDEHNDDLKFRVFKNYAMAHNLSLNALAETGLLGFIGLNLIFFSAWRFYQYRYSDRSIFILGCTICFIYITMQFGNFVHSASRTDMAFIVISLYHSFVRHRQNQSIESSPESENKAGAMSVSTDSPLNSSL